jgi:hypothetical protein
MDFQHLIEAKAVGMADDDGRRTAGGNAGKGCQSMSPGRIDLKTAWPG